MKEPWLSPETLQVSEMLSNDDADDERELASYENIEELEDDWEEVMEL